MIKLVLPKIFPNLEVYRSLPLFFLAGPILGGGDWQKNAAELLEKEVGDCIIVNPSRYKTSHPHYQYRLEGEADYFDRQTSWERYFLQKAAEDWPTGCLLFWCPLECQTNPRNDGSPYARDSYGEIGEWRTRRGEKPWLRLALGADEEFPGLNVIESNIEHQIGREFKVARSLEETVFHAVKLARPKTL